MSSKPGSDHAALTRRERQIMDIVYRLGRDTVAIEQFTRSASS